MSDKMETTVKSLLKSGKKQDAINKVIQETAWSRQKATKYVEEIEHQQSSNSRSQSTKSSAKKTGSKVGKTKHDK